MKSQEDLEAHKKNTKSTKLVEIEVESKAYKEECARLRHLLDEVIRSKDPMI